MDMSDVETTVQVKEKDEAAEAAVTKASSPAHEPEEAAAAEAGADSESISEATDKAALSISADALDDM